MLHRVVFSPITCYANCLPRLYLVRSWTVLGLSLCGVGECTPPHLVLPLTVEPSKPRLCNDDRFLNRWIEDRPFSLDSVEHLPKYVHKGFYQTVCDNKSGYDHIKLPPAVEPTLVSNGEAGTL